MTFSAKRLVATTAFSAAAVLMTASFNDTDDATVVQLQPPESTLKTQQLTAAPKATLESQAEWMFRMMDLIRKNHVDAANANDGRKSAIDAINGMLEGLDPHSHYFSPEDFKKFNEESAGEFAGIGIEITPEGRLVKVVTPMDDSPAARAGIQPGDLILQINGEPAADLGVDGVSKKIRGKEGSTVDLKLIRKGESKPIDVKLVRATIKTPPVKSALIGNDIGYMRLSNFGYAKKDANGRIITNLFGKPEEDGATLLRDAILAAKKSMGPAATGYILDLRNDPGGYLYQAVDISDHFLDAGKTVVVSRGQDRRANETLSTSVDGDLTDGKDLVILINEGSASASEVVAGALQDHKRATVLGTQSFGKGSVQTVIRMPDGGALKLTIAQYFTPNDRSVQGKGITPDILFKPLEKDETAALRTRESNLSHSLGNTKGDVADNRTRATCSPVAKDTPSAGLPDIMIDKRTNKVDDALACAVEHLRKASKLTVTTPVPQPK